MNPVRNRLRLSDGAFSRRRHCPFLNEFDADDQVVIERRSFEREHHHSRILAVRTRNAATAAITAILEADDRESLGRNSRRREAGRRNAGTPKRGICVLNVTDGVAFPTVAEAVAAYGGSVTHLLRVVKHNYNNGIYRNHLWRQISQHELSAYAQRRTRQL